MHELLASKQLPLHDIILRDTLPLQADIQAMRQLIEITDSGRRASIDIAVLMDIGNAYAVLKQYDKALETLLQNPSATKTAKNRCCSTHTSLGEHRGGVRRARDAEQEAKASETCYQLKIKYLYAVARYLPTLAVADMSAINFEFNPPNS